MANFGLLFLRSGTHRFTWQKDIFLENVEGTEIDQDKEEEANAFAAKILFLENELQKIIHAAPLDEEMIHEFAYKFRTPAGIIIGRLHHLKLIPFHMGNGFRQKIDLFDQGLQKNAETHAKYGKNCLYLLHQLHEKWRKPLKIVHQISIFVY